MDNDLLFEIQESLSIKKMRQVALYIHLPCAKATACEIGPEQALRILSTAKRRVKRENPNVKVLTYCHVDYCQFENGKKKSYFADVDRMT